MRAQLLQKLREDLPLALCVRIVSYVRRLDSLVAQASAGTLSAAAAGTPEYERQLKDEFLRCRNVWLASLSRSVSAAEPYQYVRLSVWILTETQGLKASSHSLLRYLLLDDATDRHQAHELVRHDHAVLGDLWQRGAPALALRRP